MTVAQLKQRMDRRFADVDQRFDAVDRRFAELEQRLSARIDMRFTSISDKLDSIASQIGKRFEHHDNVLGVHENRLKDLERTVGI